MTKTKEAVYIKPADSEMFRHGKAHLLHLAAGRGSARQAAAVAELERRRLNKAAKKQGR